MLGRYQSNNATLPVYFGRNSVLQVFASSALACLGPRQRQQLSSLLRRLLLAQDDPR